MDSCPGNDSKTTRLSASQCPAYILSGGRNSRFGSDKARVRIAGEFQLPRLVKALKALGHATEIVADRQDRYVDFGIRCLTDSADGQGPLAGMAAALTHRQCQNGPGWILLVTCDQLVWREHWWNELRKPIPGTPALQAVVFQEQVVLQDQDGTNSWKMQPLPGLFHTSLLTDVEHGLERGQLSLKGMLAKARTKVMTTCDNPRGYAFNTAEEFRVALRRLHTSLPVANDLPQHE